MGRPPRLPGFLSATSVYCFHKVRDEELCERRYPERLARHARGQKFGASQADVPQDFVAAKEIDHLHAVCVAWITRVERSQEWLDCDMEGKIIEFLPGWRFEAHFVRRAGASDK